MASVTTPKFTPNPYIQQSRDLGTNLLARALQPASNPLPNNPYYVPGIAPMVGQLGSGFLARQANVRADDYESRQKMAQQMLGAALDPYASFVKPTLDSQDEQSTSPIRKFLRRVIPSKRSQAKTYESLKDLGAGEIGVIAGANPFDIAKYKKSLTPTPKATDIASMRKEFTSQTDPFVSIHGSFRKMRNSFEEKTGAGDMAAIFTYMKVLDPNSAVLMGEYATAESAGRNIPTSVLQLYNQAARGAPLSGQQRKAFLDAASNIVAAERQNYDQVVKTYTDLAKSFGYNVDQVVMDRLVEPTITIVSEAGTFQQPLSTLEIEQVPFITDALLMLEPEELARAVENMSDEIKEAVSRQFDFMLKLEPNELDVSESSTYIDSDSTSPNRDLRTGRGN